MRKAGSIFFPIFLLLGTCYAQQAGEYWYFGDQAGIDFTSGSPIPLANGASFGLDCSAACDDGNGQLNFYSNGIDIYNRNHVLMANGNAIGVSHDAGQCVMIVPWPGTEKWFVFTVGNWDNANGFRYSVVDMALQGGLGEVTLKNVLLFAPSTERIAITYDAANDRYWVVTHGWNSSDFISYEVTSAGLNTVPVVSPVGSIHTGGTPSGYNAAGQMTISPDGTRLACGIYSLGRFELFDFNLANGVVSNARTINGHPRAWGAAFSPNSEFLYLTEWFGADIFQVDATNANPSATEVVVGTVSVPGQYKVGYLQLGPDDRVYAAKFNQNSLAVIQTPDIQGAGCGFSDVGLNLGASLSQAGLCRAISYDPCRATVLAGETICIGESSTLNFSGTGFIGWVEQHEQTIILSTDTTYTVQPDQTTVYMALNDCLPLSVTIQVDGPPVVALIEDTTVCNAIVLETNSPFHSSTWSTGQTGLSIEVSESGQYWLSVISPCGADADTVKVTVLECTCPIYLPNTIIPNGDLLNDLFSAVSDCEFTLYELEVFDRWGEQIFFSGIQELKWDASYKGKQVQQGIYAWRLSYSFDTTGVASELIGHVNVLR